MTTKLCCHCKLQIPVGDFSKHPTSKDGLQSSCRKCQAARWKAYKEKKGDEIREKQRLHHNKPEVRERKSRLRCSPEGRAKFNQYWRKYRQLNRQRLYEAEKLYNSRVRTNGGKFTAQDLETLRVKCRNRCLACGGTDRLAPDHVIPVCLGGSNGIENRQLLCIHCNSRKCNGTTDFRGPSFFEVVQNPSTSTLTEEGGGNVPPDVDP